MVTAKSLSFSEENCINRASRNFTKFGDGKPWTPVTSDLVVAQLFVQYVLFKLDIGPLEVSDMQHASHDSPQQLWICCIFRRNGSNIYNEIRYCVINKKK